MKCTFSLRFAAALASVGLAVVGAATCPAVAADPDVKAVYLDEPEPSPAPTPVGHAKLEEKYASGEIRVQREVVKMSDDQVINDGRYTEFYPNGKKFAEGDYVMGVHNGQWSFWHDNGQEAKIVSFKNGRADGTWEVHRPDGTLDGKKTYKNNLRSGTWLVYYEDGKTPKIEQTYVDSKLQGIRKTYFPSGKTRQEAQFDQGQLNGNLTEWDETGRKVAEATFVEGKLNGQLVRWGSDGTKFEQSFRDNKFTGEHSETKEQVTVEPEPNKDLPLLNSSRK